MLIVALAFCACGDDDDAAPDAGSAPDAGPLCTADPGETCAACFANIGTCCYEDPTIGGDVPALTASCEREPSCARCCSECAAMSCDELMASDSCPNMEP